MDPSHLKVHRHRPFLAGQAVTVLSPRPGEGPEVVADLAGEGPRLAGPQAASSLLGQWCWAVAYQRKAGTVGVVDAAGVPIVIANADLPVPDDAWFVELVAAWPLTTPSLGTVNLTTRSLERSVADEAAFYAEQKQAGIGEIKHQSRFVTLTGGAVLLGAPGIVLKSWGVQLSTPDDQRPKWFEVSGPT